MAPVILLDVHMEDLEAILSDKNWNVKTVTKELGNSSDDNILRYAQETKCILVTDNVILAQRIQAANISVVTIETADRAKIIHEKLEKIRSVGIIATSSPKNSLKYCKQHFYLL